VSCHHLKFIFRKINLSLEQELVPGPGKGQQWKLNQLILHSTDCWSFIYPTTSPSVLILPMLSAPATWISTNNLLFSLQFCIQELNLVSHTIIGEQSRWWSPASCIFVHTKLQTYPSPAHAVGRRRKPSRWKLRTPLIPSVLDWAGTLESNHRRNTKILCSAMIEDRVR